jgi:hypothetical protein
LDESWKLKARAGHQLDSYVPELPGYAGDTDQRGLNQVGWMAMRPGENVPLRPSVALGQLTELTTDTSVTPRIYFIDSNRSCAYGASPEPELRLSPASTDIP